MKIADYCSYIARRETSSADLADRIVFWLVMAFAGIVLGNCTPSPAAELILHGPSYHFSDNGMNNANYGVGYRFDNRVVAGVYHNSLGRASVYLAYLLPVATLPWNVSADVLLGAVTGYEQMAVWPAVVPILTKPMGKNWRAHISAVPVNGGFVNLSIGYQF
jgi:hypothetical protein